MAKKERPAPIRRGKTAAAAAAAAAKPEATLNDIPRWLAPVLYALVTVFVFREFIIGSGGLLGLDSLGLSYFARNFYTQFIHNFHSFPLWNPLLYGGMPFIDGMHGDIFYPPSLALFFLNAREMWGWKMALHVFMAGIFTYLWLRELGVSRGAALLGGLVYMMGADLISLTFPGGDGKLFVSALAPLSFLLTERAVRLQRVRDYAAFSLGIALVILTSHMQLAYFTVWGVSAYFIFRIVQQWRRGEWTGTRVAAHFGAFALAGVLAAGATAIQIIPPLQYLREWSQRADKTLQSERKQTAYQYSTSYSLHPEELLSLVVPEFVGDNVQTESHSGLTYWGRNGIKYNHEYAGLLGLVLLPLLFIRRRNGQTWFFAAMAALALLYAAGATTPAFHLFYMIPGVKLFRAPSLIIFLYGLALATLGALALDRGMEIGRADDDAPASARKALWILVGALIVLAILLSSGLLLKVWQAVIFPDINSQQQAFLERNLGHMKAGGWIAVAVASAIVLSWEAYARRIFTPRMVLIALCIIAFVEENRVSAQFVRGTTLLNQTADATQFVPDESIAYLKQRQEAGEVFRAFDMAEIIRSQYQNYPVNGLATHGIEQLAGHHGNEMGRYRELLGGDQPYRVAQGQLSLLDVTNTEYVVFPQPINIPGYTQVFQGSRSVVMRKADVLPRAYLVGNVEVVPDAGAVDRLLSPGFNYRTTAILPQPLPAGVNIQPDPQGSVQWLERTPNYLRLKVITDRPALLMVLDNYYKAWHAHVDDDDAEILRANHVFRAVPVPAGTHEVSFGYNAMYLHTPAMVSAFLLLLLAVIAFGAPIRDRLRSRAEPTTA